MHLKVPNLLKSAEKYICWAGKKRKDENNETKLHLHREWTIIVFKWFAMNYFSSLYGHF